MYPKPSRESILSTDLQFAPGRGHVLLCQKNFFSPQNRGWKSFDFVCGDRNSYTKLYFVARRILKDYLKKIKLFRARASPVYSIVAFEDDHDIHNHDPVKTSFEYARKARSLAVKIQDFTAEYTAIARKCEDFAKGLLDKCTTKHEVQTLLQTR